MNKGEKYCTACGTIRLPISNGHSFNGDTGERIEFFKLVCPNPSCQKGCGEIGHVFPIFSAQCKRCGYKSNLY